MTLSCYICSVNNNVNVCSFFKCWDCGKVVCSRHSLVCLECDRTFCVTCLPDDEDCDCDSNYTVETDEDMAYVNDDEYEELVRRYTNLKDDEEYVCR